MKPRDATGLKFQVTEDGWMLIITRKPRDLTSLNYMIDWLTRVRAFLRDG